MPHIDISQCVLSDVHIPYSTDYIRASARVGYHEYYLPSNGKLAFVSPDEKQIQVYSAFAPEDLEPFQKVTFYAAPPFPNNPPRQLMVSTVAKVDETAASLNAPQFKRNRRFWNKYSDSVRVETLNSLNLQDALELFDDWLSSKNFSAIQFGKVRRALHNAGNYPSLRVLLFYLDGKLMNFSLFSLPEDYGLDLPVSNIYEGKLSPDAPNSFGLFVDTYIGKYLYDILGKPFYLNFGGSSEESLRFYKQNVFPVAFEFPISVASADVPSILKRVTK